MDIQQVVADFLALLAEAVADKTQKRRGIGDGDVLFPNQADYRGIHFGRWAEGGGRHTEQEFRSAKELCLDAQESVGARAGMRCDSFGHFLLQQKDGALEQGTDGQGFFDDGRGDVVGKIADYCDWSPLCEVGFEDIAFDDGEARLVAEFGAQVLDQDRVDFDCDDAGRLGEEVGGECAAAWSDFDYGIGRLRARGFRDTF